MSSTDSARGLDSSDHPAVETISDYLEDLLSPEAAAELHTHFATCSECLDTRDAIDEIRSLLGHGDAPQLPTDIGIRIDAALAAEALLSAGRPSAPTVGLPASRSSAAQDRPGTPHGGPPARRDGSAPAGRSSRPRATGRLRKAVIGLASIAVIGLGGGAVLHALGSSGSSSGASSSAAAGVADGAGTAGTRFTDSAFPQQVQQLLRSTDTMKAEPRSQGAQQESSRPASGPEANLPPATVPGCVSAAIGRAAERPLALSLGSYGGQQVYAVVYADRADPAHTVDGYLVSSSCANNASPQPPATILLQRTVPRD